MRLVKYWSFALTVATAISGYCTEVAGLPMVWAHYVPWHSPKDVPFSSQKYINYPLLRNPGSLLEAYQREFELATMQGIDGFFVDIISKGDDIAFLDRAQAMLKAAEGSSFQIGFCLDGKVPAEKQAQSVIKMLTMGARHPNYPKYNGKPVLATYIWYNYTPEEWRMIRARAKTAGFDIFLIANLRAGSYRTKDMAKMQSYAPVFDMGYSFGENGIDGETVATSVAKTAQVCQDNGKPVMGIVYPGYYGTWRHGRNDFYQSHLGFDRMHECFQALVPGREKWLHFTSWNDHDETSIMPMLFTDGNPEIVRAYSDRFKQVAPAAKTPRIFAAYHREVYPGTLWRLEFLSIPVLAGSSVEISGYLADYNGKNVFVLSKKRLNTEDFDRIEYAVPTGKLAESPVLYPVINIRSKEKNETVTLPALLLKSGSFFNGVTVKTGLHNLAQMNTPPRIQQKNNVLMAEVSIDSPEKVKSATLFRNDLALAAFSSISPQAPLLHLLIDISGGSPDYQISLPQGGQVIRAIRFSSSSGDKGFEVSEKNVRSVKNFNFTTSGITLAMRPEDVIRLEADRQSPMSITAGELLKRHALSIGRVNFMVVPDSPTAQNASVLDCKVGTLKVEVLSRPARPDDCFFVRYELASGKVGWSPVVFPFENRHHINKNVLNTAITMETFLDVPPECRPKEYLDNKSICGFAAGITIEKLHPATVRGNRWTFEDSGADSLGELPIRQGAYNQNLPLALLAKKQGYNGGTALNFSGNVSLTMPYRSFPVGAFTLDFYLNPILGPEQTVLFHRGLASTISIDLSAEGILRITRSGKNEKSQVISDQLTAKSPLRKNVWNHVRVTFDEKELRLYLDNKLNAASPVRCLRAYGNSIWSLGGGNPKQAGFQGMIDDVTLLGQSFRPDELK